MLDSRIVNAVPIRSQRNCRTRNSGSKKVPLSGLSERGGGMRWNASVICETYKTNWQTEKSPYGRNFGIPFDGPVIPFGAEFYSNPNSMKDNSRLYPLGTKTLPGIFIGHGAAFWRRLDRRFDHRGLARHREPRCFRSSRPETEESRRCKKHFFFFVQLVP